MRLQVWHLFVLMMFIAVVAVVAVIIIAAVRSSQRGTPPAVGTGRQATGLYPTPSPGPIDPEKRLAALRELAQMRKDGLLTEDEYQAEVRRLG
ncbi:SHOCT domain-containing protein [Occultella aeris]|uniref:SHOCT domain-containing protein n=1 Tax=Occultella aeris TaxID=2761496 RepID=A0A7M4DSL0_9MICO|nr:SHOCT domain-containing protein [Occultella aeris]VZO40454.1 hypothetical protein HALOF300_05158 [Occultella aeris]